jgi:hypothetical protein
MGTGGIILSATAAVGLERLPDDLNVMLIILHYCGGCPLTLLSILHAEVLCSSTLITSSAASTAGCAAAVPAAH